jgi:hypothetical protein
MSFMASRSEANDDEAIGNYAATVDEIASKLQSACGLKDQR